MDNPDLEVLHQSVSDLIAKINPDKLHDRLTELEILTSQPNFWSDEQQAKLITQEISLLNSKLETINNLNNKLADLDAAKQLLDQQNDESLRQEFTQNLFELRKLIDQSKIDTYLSGPYDNYPAILAIHSGQGGTEAMDWASMLSRMYQRFFERKNWPYELIEESPGEEAGIKSVTFIINAPLAFGLLKYERGAHRLVRLSPFNANNLRQTSFAGVEVTPVLDEAAEIEIKNEDLEFDAFRSSGAGGQNVNKVSTAVRLRHIPSGIVVTCQSQRQQDQNRKIALQLLKAKLWEIQEQKRLEEAAQIKGEHKIPGWGNQIRSYVLHPYKQVKDLRTEFVSTNPDAILDGQLEDFVNEELRYFA